MFEATLRSTPAFAIGGVKAEFACVCCGSDTATHHILDVRGVCPSHCFDHDFEYDRYARACLCIHCSEEQEYEPSDDDVGFGSYYEPREPVGIPASSMNGNASERHKDPAAWDRWVGFCNSWGAP